MEQAVINDLQTSLMRMEEERDKWVAVADSLANIVYQAGCYTYPSYLRYLEAKGISNKEVTRD